MDVMNAEFAALGPLLGVLVGVFGTLLTTAMQQRAENKRTRDRLSEDRRKTSAEFVVAFSALETRVWTLIGNLQKLDSARKKAASNPQVAASLQSQFEAELVHWNTIGLDLLERLEMIRIVVPVLSDAATDLVHVSGVAIDDLGSDHDTERQTARKIFEKDARAFLND